MRAYKSVHAASDRADGAAREVLTLALPPTEPAEAGTIDGTGRPGLWRVRAAEGGPPLDVFVQRDDVVLGFGAVRRVQSRLWDESYVPLAPDGRPVETDEAAGRLGAGGPIRRAGSVNAYAAVRGAALVRVGGRLAGRGGRGAGTPCALFRPRRAGRSTGGPRPRGRWLRRLGRLVGSAGGAGHRRARRRGRASLGHQHGGAPGRAPPRGCPRRETGHRTGGPLPVAPARGA